MATHHDGHPVGRTVGQVKVMLFNVADEAADIEAAYHTISRELAGVPGLLGNELLRSVVDARQFVVLSTWSDIAAFNAWEQGADHKRDTAPLRPFRDPGASRPFGIYQVTTAYGHAAATGAEPVTAGAAAGTGR